MSSYKVYGKHRAKVVDIADPLREGRVKTILVETEVALPWATPCFTPSQFSVPKKGMLVWIEFEEGDSEKPIWTGWIPTKDEIKAMNPGYDGTILIIQNDKLKFNGTKSSVIESADIDIKGGTVDLTGSAVKANGEDLSIDL